MRMSAPRAAMIAAAAMAIPGLLFVAFVASGGGLSPLLLVVTLIPAALGWAAVRASWDRMSWVGWAVVWLAIAGWFDAVLFASGDPALLRACWAGFLALPCTLFVLAAVHLGPWNEGRIATLGHH